MTGIKALALATEAIVIEANDISKQRAGKARASEICHAKFAIQMHESKTVTEKHA